jgi:hypothetical protein
MTQKNWIKQEKLLDKQNQEKGKLSLIWGWKCR